MFKKMANHGAFKPFTLLIAVVASSVFVASNSTTSDVPTKQSYIVSADNYQSLLTSVQQMGIEPTHELAIIDALAITVSKEQLTKLQAELSVTVSENHQVETAGGWQWGKRKWQPQAVVNNFVEATPAHQRGNFGQGVTIGFLDTGLDQLGGLSHDLYGRDKVWGTYDAINNTEHNYHDEVSGHGTHVASIAVNSDFDAYGRIYGVAPNAAIVGIKAFDQQGKATYADVIRGIDWALQRKDDINLRILNMSFSGPVRSYYWEDPLNKAVMKAWQNGIVVVASAGNRGPDPMTIGVPGNVPYIITVGAMTDSYTPTDFVDDKLAIFSAAGPTIEGFVKPEIVAPGGHMSGLMEFDSQIVIDHPDFHDGGRYFEMSGTSQATAVVSGVAALLLTQDPSLTPDQVKCRLLSGARSAIKNDGKLAYSVFQQGSGVVDAESALASTESDCANYSLNVAQDLSGERHFYGPANINADGDFYIEGLGSEFVWDIPKDFASDSGFIWRTAIETDSGFIWRTAFGTDSGFIWRTAFDTDSGFIWRTNFETDSGFIWRTNVDIDSGFIWRTSVDFTSTEGIDVNNWVEPQ